MSPVRRADIVTKSSAATEALATRLGSRLGSGACIALIGGLGAGKTVFVRGMCRGLGIVEDVLSPTFILYEAFAGRLPVVHVDLYRLEHESEIEALGVFDLIGSNTVLLVEWGDRSDTLMESADATVEIAIAGEPGRRRVTFTWTPPLDGVFSEVAAWSS